MWEFGKVFWRLVGGAIDKVGWDDDFEVVEGGRGEGFSDFGVDYGGEGVEGCKGGHGGCELMWVMWMKMRGY